MMTNEIRTAALLSDSELLAQVKTLAAAERDATVRLIAVLAELDERRLYLAQGCSSLFTYYTQVLHLSDHAAYGRIEAARAARRCPMILDLLADGSLHLTAVGLLRPHLTTENHAEILAAAHHKSKREIEELVASLRPQPPLPSAVRKLPATGTPGSAGTMPFVSVSTGAETGTDHGDPTASAIPVQHPPPRAEVKPLAPARYKVQFTASQEIYDKLRLAQDLLRHAIPSGDVATIVDRALTLLVQELQKSKHAAVARPRASRPAADQWSGRHVPAHVRREVWKRDGGQCAFVGAVGRCTERGFLEYHHRVPFADGGRTTVENIELRCRAHNAYEAEQWFGSDVAREVAPALGFEAQWSVSGCSAYQILPDRSTTIDDREVLRLT